MRNAIPFRGRCETIWLTSGSQAHKLATEGKTKELAAHMKDVEARYDALADEAAPIAPEQWAKLTPEGGFKRGEFVLMTPLPSSGGKSRLPEMFASVSLECRVLK